MKTHLYIKVNNQWKEVDMFNDISIPITLKVTDIRQFGSKSSGYSLDFDIPHTANNAILFGLNADIDVYRGSFEVGKDYEAYLSDGCFTTFQGQFRLKKVVKQNSGKYIFYVGYLYGGTKNFVDRLGTQTLSGNEDPNNDLSFSEYNTPGEEMTLSDFVDRLQSHYTDGEDWGLTLIDKTNKYSQSFSGGAQQWYANECTPYLGAMGIFNRIISGAGYRYTSKFLMGNDGNTYLTGDGRWKDTIGRFDVYSMIYPYMRNNSLITTLDPVYTTVTQLSADSTTNLYTVSMPSGYDFERWVSTNYNSSTRNAFVNFDSTDYSLQQNKTSSTLSEFNFVAAENGYYTIHLNFLYNLKFKVYVPYLGRYIQGREEASTDNSQKYNVTVLLLKNGRTYLSSSVTDENYSISFTTYGQSDGYCKLWLSGNEKQLYYDNTIELNAGDTLSISLQFDFQLYKSVWNAEDDVYDIVRGLYYQNGNNRELIEIRDLSFYTIPNEEDNSIIFNAVQQNGFYEENTFYPQVILNPKTTKLDYFNEFVKMFNLYVEDVSGKKNYETGGIYPDKCLRIEPYECFYAPLIAQNDTNLKDWTDRIDWDVVEYMRIEDYLYNIQKFTKVQNKDYFNEQYNSTYILPYADRDIKGPYCTSDEKNEIELKTGGYLCGIVNQSTDTLQCPKAFSINKNNLIDTKKEYSDAFFFIWRNYMNENTDLENNYTIKLQSRINNSYQNVTNYFCADTLNKGYGLDDANLNWGPTDNYYQNMKGTKPTYNDLYSAFYKKQYEEYTDPDARIMKAKAYLTAFDIATVQLSDGIIIDGHLWRILEIKEWRDEKTPCEIELIKVLEGIYKPPVETPPGTNTNEPYVPIEDPEVIK